MAAVRRRRLVDDGSVPTRPRPKRASAKSSSSGSTVQKCFLLLVGFVAITFIAGSYMDILPWSVHRHAITSLDKLAFSLGLQKHVHAVVIDAGSTASRVLAFTFHESLDRSLKLDNELFVEVKPGLSSFAHEPKKGAEKINELLDRAKKEIPQSDWGKTPLALKATAGLRLLPEQDANGLLKEVRDLFAESQFLTNSNSVSIMDGVDEGIFSWFTVNFLKDRLGGNIPSTVAALDLGGGSTQITFATIQEDTIKQAKPDFLHHVSLFHQNMTLYSYSYLGLGLMAARMAILSTGNPQGSTELHSECINPIITGAKWTYNRVDYTVKGPLNPGYKVIKGSSNSQAEKRPVVRYTECSKLIKEYVSSKVDKPAELKNREINAFSYYYDRATEYGLIDPFTGGTVTVNDFQKAAINTCDTPNTEQPFMCLDLTFISVLLQDGFGLEPKTKLNLQKHIDGHEVSWALGAAFHILQNGL